VQSCGPNPRLLVEEPGDDGQADDAGAGQDVGQVRVRVVVVPLVLQLQPRRACAMNLRVERGVAHHHTSIWQAALQGHSAQMKQQTRPRCWGPGHREKGNRLCAGWKHVQVADEVEDSCNRGTGQGMKQRCAPR